MNLRAWHEEAISKSQDRTSFDCGEAALNDFLRTHARKSHERGGSKTFVAVRDVDNRTILGFYSLSPVSVEYAKVPDLIKKGLARYEVPGFRLARLGVDQRWQGQGLGGQLLLATGRRCLRAAAEVGGVALVIDAKNDSVAQWYERYGAVRLADANLTLMLPLGTIAAALQSQDT